MQTASTSSCGASGKASTDVSSPFTAPFREPRPPRVPTVPSAIPFPPRKPRPNPPQRLAGGMCPRSINDPLTIKIQTPARAHIALRYSAGCRRDRSRAISHAGVLLMTGRIVPCFLCLTLLSSSGCARSYDGTVVIPRPLDVRRVWDRDPSQTRPARCRRQPVCFRRRRRRSRTGRRHAGTRPRCAQDGTSGPTRPAWLPNRPTRSPAGMSANPASATGWSANSRRLEHARKNVKRFQSGIA